MLSATFIPVRSLLLFTVFLLTNHFAAAQWNAPYANSWIDYGKKYVKVPVSKTGLYQIPFSALPPDFKVDAPEKLQLWRRGKEVAIISTAGNAVLFYGESNDGASDSLLYRPMSARVNPFFSMYSDQSAYFLTVGTKPGLRASSVDKAPGNAAVELKTHQEINTVVLSDQYSLSTNYAITKPTFQNSFFEFGASKTGKAQAADNLLIRKFQLHNAVLGNARPHVRLLLHGRSDNDRQIEIYAGKNENTLRLVKSLPNADFGTSEYAFDLLPADLNTDQTGIIAFKNPAAGPDYFSLTYYLIDYPQKIDFEIASTKILHINPTEKESKLLVKSLPAAFQFLDITNPANPVLLKRSGDYVSVAAQPDHQRAILVTKDVTELSSAKLQSIQFHTYPFKESDFIIITTESLAGGASEYARYRQSAQGGGFSPLIVQISDIYNQYNYGEPSPVAIRKFVSHMLNAGGKDKYLFLIGKSITHNERMKRELPEEVPTIGYPGSDLLLVEGLAGEKPNVPAIPLGRLSADKPQQVLDYLQKVKEYESNAAGELAWRKQVMHLTGGKTVAELGQLKDYLKNQESAVTNGILGGQVTHLMKQQAMEETEQIDIARQVNDGAGLISFFGHGSPELTDPDIGYATDATRGYQNRYKYPVMYFNGCGVGNIFSARFNPNPDATDRMSLSLDWLLAPKKGAIAVIASSFDTFISPAAGYIQTLYKYMFSDAATAGLPIGKIQQAVAADIAATRKDKISIANLHQTILQGDPALKLITVDLPDYAITEEAGITLLSQSEKVKIGQSETIHVKVKMQNNGRYIASQQVPVTVNCFGKSGNMIGQETIPAFALKNELSFSFKNPKDLRKIQVQIDPAGTISELNKANNSAVLEAEWNAVKDQFSITSGFTKDRVAPLLKVQFNNRLIQNDEIINPDPKLSVQLIDDRQLHADTSLFDIYIKYCADESCDFQKVVLSDNADITTDPGKFVQLNYHSNWKAGDYEILVNAKDQSGNTIANAYRLRFKIAGPDQPAATLIVSPNPATSYIKFQLTSPANADIKSVRYTIRNQRGVIVADNTAGVPVNFPQMEWYWFPAGSNAGMYIYQLILSDSKNELVQTFTGKLVLVN